MIQCTHCNLPHNVLCFGINMKMNMNMMRTEKHKGGSKLEAKCGGEISRGIDAVEHADMILAARTLITPGVFGVV